MKKYLSILISVLLMAFLMSCSNNNTNANNTNVPPSESNTEKKDFNVAMVTDIGGIDDRSFNQSTWEGIEKFSKEYSVPSVYAQSNTDADYIPNLSTFADDKYNLIIAPGYLIQEAIETVSENYKDSNFLIIDAVVEGKENVASAIFAEHEGSYLLGTIAAKLTKEAGKDTVGFIGGVDFDVIRRFESGFEQGVKDFDPSIKIISTYVGDFIDAGKGQSIASKMYDEGAYIVYHAAGNAGNGLIKEAKDRRMNGQDVWAMGVDRDQYADGIYADNKSAILTSMVKKVDVVAYDICKLALENKFENKVFQFDLKNKGVGLPKENPNLSEELIKLADDTAEKIIKGEITVSPMPERLKNK